MATPMRKILVVGLISLPILMVVASSTSRAAQAPVGLKTAESFAVLAGSTITNTGLTTITGDVGLHPGTAMTGFDGLTDSVVLDGERHTTDAVASLAKTDLVTAYNDAAGRGPVTEKATELGGTTLMAGVYDSAAGTFGITGTLTLDAENVPGAVFIFQMESTLITATGSAVNLINGADACNVFWQVGSSATLEGATRFKGNILAMQSITLVTGAQVVGRTLARTGAVTMDTNSISKESCSSASTPTATPTESPTATPTDAPTATPTDAPTATPTATPTPTPTPGVLIPILPTPAPTQTPSPTPSPLPAPTSTPTASPAPIVPVVPAATPGAATPEVSVRGLNVVASPPAIDQQSLPRTGASIGMFVLVALGLITGGAFLRRWAGSR